MKLASLKKPSPHRDGALVVVSRDNKRATRVPKSLPQTLREAVENWQLCVDALESLYSDLNKGRLTEGVFDVDAEDLHSALPRAFAWVDASAFINHIVLVRKSRGAEPPEDLKTRPLMYQGGGDYFLDPLAPIPQEDAAHGTDFEAEVGVILDDVPMGVGAEEALSYIRLFVLVNDVSLRGLVPTELKQGFGFFQSKPPSALSPFACTADELGEFWRNGKLHLPLLVRYKGQEFGRANAGEMHFHFGELIAHAARTRPLKAGTLLGSGTVSNEDTSAGCSCLAEKRMLEVLAHGKASTPFMQKGDVVEIQMRLPQGEDIFGTIRQEVD